MTTSNSISALHVLCKLMTSYLCQDILAYAGNLRHSYYHYAFRNVDFYDTENVRNWHVCETRTYKTCLILG